MMIEMIERDIVNDPKNVKNKAAHVTEMNTPIKIATETGTTTGAEIELTIAKGTAGN